MVGLFLLVGIALIAFLAINLGNLTEGNKETYQIKILFRNASGIIKGSEVRLGGAKIGKVTSTPVLTSEGDNVELTLELDGGIRLQKGSIAQAATLNLLGDKYVEISPPASPTGEFIKPGQFIYGDSGDDLETIKSNVATISQQTVVLLDRVGLAMDDMQKAAKGFAELADRLNDGVLSDNNLTYLEVTMSNVAETSTNLAKSSAAIPETLENIKDVTQNIKDTSDGIHKLVTKVDKKIDDMEPAFAAVSPTINTLKQTTEKLDRVITKVDKGNGILGALINDQSMKKDLQDFIKHLRSQGILRYKNPKAEEEMIDLRDRARMEGRRN